MGNRLAGYALIAMAIASLFFGFNNLFVPTAAQAESVATIAGREYLQLLAEFDRNRIFIRLHVGLGVVFIVLAAFQFWREFRNKSLKRHRIVGYATMACLVLLPLTAIVCTLVYPYAGPWGFLPNVIWLAAIGGFVVAAFRAARRRDFADHEAWITRATGMTLGIALPRAYQPLFVHVFHIVPHVAFFMTFWLGQLEGLAIAEAWLRRAGGPLARKAARLAKRSVAPA